MYTPKEPDERKLTEYMKFNDEGYSEQYSGSFQRNKVNALYFWYNNRFKLKFGKKLGTGYEKELTFDELVSRLETDVGYGDHVHDFIQWLFPTDRESDYNDNSPTVVYNDGADDGTDGGRAKARENLPDLDRESMKRAYQAYKKFLTNLKNNTNSHRYKGLGFNSEHNASRISRVLRFLYIFGIIIGLN